MFALFSIVISASLAPEALVKTTSARDFEMTLSLSQKD